MKEALYLQPGNGGIPEKGLVPYIDIQGMEDFCMACRQLGYPFKVDSAEGFDMGDSSGRFSYVEDPDGTLMELVELRKSGVFINPKKDGPKKAIVPMVGHDDEDPQE